MKNLSGERSKQSYDKIDKGSHNSYFSTTKLSFSSNVAGNLNEHTLEYRLWCRVTKCFMLNSNNQQDGFNFFVMFSATIILDDIDCLIYRDVKTEIKATI